MCNKICMVCVHSPCISSIFPFFSLLGNGWYVYIESSAPRRPGDKAQLASPLISDQQTRCLSFWYHMYGTHVNTLNVYLQSGSPGLGTPLWTKKGTQGNKWIQGQLTITPSNAYQVIFEGVRGTSYRGDIAIDDVRLSLGPCQTTGGE